MKSPSMFQYLNKTQFKERVPPDSPSCKPDFHLLKLEHKCLQITITHI